MSGNLVLIDTSVWILALRKSPPAVARDEAGRLLAHTGLGRAVLTFATYKSKILTRLREGVMLWLIL